MTRRLQYSLIALALTLVVGVAAAQSLWRMAQAGDDLEPVRRVGRATEQAAEQPRPDLLEQAAERFAEADYAGATDAYEQLVERHPRNADLLYNLGTAHARDGQRGLAAWRFLQALELAPRDNDLRHNLRAVAPDIDEQLGPTPLPPFNWVYQRLSANDWAALTMGLSALGLVLCAAGWMRMRGARVRRGLLRVGTVLIVAGLLCLPPAIGRYRQDYGSWRAVVVGEGVTARTGPSASQIETFSLPVGTIVQITDATTPGWYRITFRGGLVGFVAAEDLRPL